MKNWKILTLSIACLAAFSLSMPDDADARRFGGGRSFGSSSQMSRPAPAPSFNTNRQHQSSTFQQRQSTAGATAGAGAAASTMSRPGWGGVVGGLLAGSVIGSMLFGGSSGVAGAGMAPGVGAGAGMGGGILDLLVLGLLAFLGFKLFRRFKMNQQNNQPNYRQDYQNNNYQNNTLNEGSSWDRLSDNQPVYDTTATDNNAYATIPADFDQADFLKGAKMAYQRLQSSWDRRDMDDIAQFTTPPVMDAMRAQYAEDPNPSVTQLLKVDASVLEVRRDAQCERVSVYFDVLMREDPQQPNPEQVREMWHFVRNLSGDESWRLDGIQQII